MKKDKKWFVDKWTKERNKTDVHDPMYHFINEFIADVNQLDEPETLSQEWIDEHEMPISWMAKEQKVVRVEHLQSLLVPKQELPVIPKFVAEWYENEGKRSSWWNWFYKWGRDESRTDLETKTIKWMQDYNEEKFVDMFLHGYEVAEEQKYYVMNEENELILGWIQSAYMTPCIEGYEYMKHNGRENLFQLTEQEIKDYDDRYWPFAVKVEEME